MRKTLSAAVLAAWILLPVTLAEEVAAGPDGVRPLLIGATVPPVTVAGGDGEAVDLGEVLSNKPTVVIFYRGGW
ncbi:MAG: hypothetical protein GTN89_12665 [Acidobacteria bacterium]|nr:hypothetical protein [Acidobacteriota bacterium]NIM63858.1 hypothetical protein [Acidobacteriota bacterium]NIO60127.1 hypothetical protein [Acidobacteriota bacterium]NIQ31191.1 hypothetical protein [Acidobacteriota bacterium]NIQ86328.1 hypothetical protein [Acidobacteriota bacterium]